VGDALLHKEVLCIEDSQQTIVRYTVIKSNGEVTLSLNPLLTYRSIHGLLRANKDINPSIYDINFGKGIRLYNDMPWLNIQFNQEFSFQEKREWYYNIEYDTERERGYDYQEDLFSIGSFIVPLKCGQSVDVSLSLLFEEYMGFAAKFNKHKQLQSVEGYSPIEVLRKRSSMFVVNHGNDTSVIAGYPWFGSWGRDSFISLPGLTLSNGDVTSCHKVIASMISKMKDGLFVNMGSAYNTVDASLWFFWTLQELEKHTSSEEITKKYFKVMTDILSAYRDGNNKGISMRDNSLIYASVPGKALTWMDALIDNCGVTARDGYQVEVNALWYNAVCYTLSLAEKHNKASFIKKWHDMPSKIEKGFRDTFINDTTSYLNDFVNEHEENTFMRPNQIIACSLEYSPLNKEEKEKVFKAVKSHLLTPMGLRTLSKDNPMYKPHCFGTQRQRDLAYHNGTVWVWQLEHFVKCGFNLYGEKYKKRATDILKGFDDEVWKVGLGSISEIFDGDLPHKDCGTIAQAWSVASLIRIDDMIKEQ
ncbi:MAG: amylo-alpha-1,6-glucosidase, partial [Rikenellaceae bacterium]